MVQEKSKAMQIWSKKSQDCETHTILIVKGLQIDLLDRFWFWRNFTSHFTLVIPQGNKILLEVNFADLSNPGSNREIKS